MKNFQWVFITLAAGAMVTMVMTGAHEGILPHISWDTPAADAKESKVTIGVGAPIPVPVTTAVASHEIIEDIAVKTPPPQITDTAPAPAATVTDTAPAPVAPPAPHVVKWGHAHWG